MGTPENTKLCDFTSTKNNDFICTPIAPPTPEANIYEIKPTLLNLVMKEQFSGASSDDVIRLKRIYNFLCSMLVLHHLLHVLFILRGIFMRFPELTY
jgi:hypothetical protein